MAGCASCVRIVTALGCLTLITVPAFAQISGSLRAIVVDATAAPIANATATVRDVSGAVRRVTTGSDGRFTVDGLGDGIARLTVTSIGFESVELSVELPTGADEVQVTLTPAGLQETVVVIGATGVRRSGHLGTDDMLTSVDVVGADQLERENVDLSLELLKKVPGVNVSDFNQGLIAGDLGIRGFNTEGEVAHVRLLIDGIPSNLNSGLSDLNAIFPFEIDRIEIVKGTNDPRYGLLNIAGNVQVFTHAPGRYTKAKLLGGAYGTADAQAVTSFSTGRLSHVYFGGYRRSTGYRDNSDLDRAAFSGKWSYAAASERWRVGMIARSYQFDTQAPGYLTPAEVDIDPRQSPAFSATDGGQQTNRHLSVHWDQQLTPALLLSLKSYRQTFERQRWVRFTSAGAQQERFEDEAQHGAILTMTVRPSRLAARQVAFSWGADYRAQHNLAQRHATVTRARGARLRDQDFDFAYGGAYLMADGRPLSWLRVNGGMRVDRTGGNFVNRLSGQELPIIDYGTIWQPKLGVMVTPRTGFNVYGNYGRAFQIGVGAGAYGTAPLGYSKNDGWEAGIRSAPASWLAARVGIWGQDATDEVRLKFDNSGDSENVGHTRRRGWNLELTARAHPTTYVWASYTRQRAILVEPGRTQPQLRGHELDHVPSFTAKAGIDVTPASRLSTSVWLEGQGDYHLTTANTLGRYGDRALTHVDVFYRLRRLTLGWHVKNVFDQYHEYAWFDGLTTLHSPGERRAFYATSAVAF